MPDHSERTTSSSAAPPYRKPPGTGCKHGHREDYLYWHAWQEGRAFGWAESHRGRVYEAWKWLRWRLGR